jgi:hypothetical protein
MCSYRVAASSVFDPVTHNFIKPRCADRTLSHDELRNHVDIVHHWNCTDTLWSNSTRRVKFAVRLHDLPAGYIVGGLRNSSGIVTALWGMSTRRLAAPQDDFVPVGGGELLESPPTGSRFGTPFIYLERTWPIAPFQHGDVLYPHLWLCDSYLNCAMRWGYPITIDTTPPPLPTFFSSDYITRNLWYPHLPAGTVDNVNFFLVDPWRVKVAWGPYNASLPSRDAPSLYDPESGLVWSTFRLWRLNDDFTQTSVFTPNRGLANADGVADALGAGRPSWRSPGIPDRSDAPDYGRFSMVQRQKTADLRADRPGTYPKGSYHCPLDVCPLTVPGAYYQVEVHLFNLAGGITNWRSGRIMADFTPPVCTPPVLSAVDAPIVPAHVPIDGASTWAGTRGFNWMRRGTQNVMVNVNRNTCVDAESRMHQYSVAVGTQNGIDDLLAMRTLWDHTQPGADTIPPQPYSLDVSPWAWFHTDNIADYTECSDCGPALWINNWCVNRASLRSACRHPAMLRVDDSPPICRVGVPLLGHGRFLWAQSETHKLVVRNFHYALYDHETGIARVTYLLEDLTSGDVVNLTKYDHEGLPRDLEGEITNSKTAYGLQLRHGHWYRINATGESGVGVLTPSCATSATLVDTTPPALGQARVTMSNGLTHVHVRVSSPHTSPATSGLCCIQRRRRTPVASICGVVAVLDTDNPRGPAQLL